jgi:Bax protein
MKYISIKVIAVLLTSIFLSSCQSNQEQPIDPDSVKTEKKLTDSNKNFILSFYPSAVEANTKIKLQRSMLINLRDDYRHVIKRKLKLDELNELAEEYRFGEQFFTDTTSLATYQQQIDTLLYHVDYIPEKLIMAQAIIESGWGKSKFAREINNYFGIHCYTPGCGRAASEVENPKFWVKSFPTIEACIEEYLWLLNTGFAYESLRETRKKLRKEDNWPNAKALAHGLERYSEKGSEYIKLIDSIINNYLPENLDAFVKMEKEAAQPPA